MRRLIALTATLLLAACNSPSANRETASPSTSASATAPAPADASADPSAAPGASGATAQPSGAAGTARPAGTPSGTAAPPATLAPPPAGRPAYDASAKSCKPEKAPALAKDWKTSVDPKEASATASVKLGLRNGSGNEQESHIVTATVFAPDGSGVTTQSEVNADAWTYVSYTRDFRDAPSPRRAGAYTVVWDTIEGQVACDGFVVS